MNFVFIDEPVEITPGDKLILGPIAWDSERTLSDGSILRTKGSIFCISTPLGRNWFQDGSEEG